MARLTLTREQKVADRFLRGFDMIEDRLESSLVGLENAESARTSITSSIDSMSLGGGHRDKMAESLVRMDEAVESLSNMAERFIEQFKDVEELISDVQRIDAQAGKVLRLTYIDRLTAKEIGKRDDMAYSKTMIYVFLKRGLDLAYKLLGEG